MIYLDNNATSHCDPEIIQLITDSLSDATIGNPSSNHAFGWKAHALYEESLENIAHSYNALPDDVVITSGASEANNHAIMGIIQTAYLDKNSRRKIIVSSIEHKCVLNSARFACALFNYELIVIPVTQDGIIDLNILKHQLSDDVLLVSIMAVNNEIGTVQPIQEIGQLCKQYGIIFHVDAAQAGYENIDMISANIDLLSLSGHKIYGPIGVGALIIDSMIKLKPQPLIQGGLQQLNYRSGTIAPYLCQAMSLAVTKIHNIRHQEAMMLCELRSYLLDQLNKNNIKYIINGSMKYRHPGNLNISLIGKDNEVVVQQLQPQIAISTGSACNSGIIEDSYVLKALNLSNDRINSAIRICLGRFNTKNDIDNFVQLLLNVVYKTS